MYALVARVELALQLFEQVLVPRVRLRDLER